MRSCNFCRWWKINRTDADSIYALIFEWFPYSNSAISQADTTFIDLEQRTFQNSCFGPQPTPASKIFLDHLIEAPCGNLSNSIVTEFQRGQNRISRYGCACEERFGAEALKTRIGFKQSSNPAAEISAAELPSLRLSRLAAAGAYRCFRRCSIRLSK